LIPASCVLEVIWPYFQDLRAVLGNEIINRSRGWKSSGKQRKEGQHEPSCKLLTYTGKQMLKGMTLGTLWIGMVMLKN